MAKTCAKDWTGQKFHRLTIIKPTDKRRGKSILWEALCDCGNKTILVPYEARSGNTTSCVCFRLQRQREADVKRYLKIRKYEPVISSARMV